MFDAVLIAKYFLSKDCSGKLFNSRKFEEGNVRLNKYLFLAQVVYLAKYETKLIANNFVAFDNGPVIEEVVNNYEKIVSNNKVIDLPNVIKSFLDKIYESLKNASNEELIEITCEDPEWIRLKEKSFNKQIMKLEENISEYKHRYKGIIEALNFPNKIYL